MATTIPAVFIIESNSWKNENNNIREGLVLSEILTLSNKPVKYKYIRTKKEFIAVLKQFKKSNFRYLHLATHGYGNGFSFTLDDISFKDFADIVSPYLHGRRLFISACGCVEESLAAPILRDTRCFSVIGPQGNILFSDAATMWSSFYALIFKKNSSSMKHTDIEDVLKPICSLFKVKFNAYFKTKKSPFYRFKNFPQKKNPSKVKK